MGALSRYLVGVAVILSAVLAVSAMTMSEIFVHISAVAQAPATAAPRWNIERLKAEPDPQYVAQGLLTPLYPATPGKELLGKPVYITTAKRNNIRQPLQLHNLPQELYAVGERDNNYQHQSLGYTETWPLQPRTRVIFGREIY